MYTTLQIFWDLLGIITTADFHYFNQIIFVALLCTFLTASLDVALNRVLQTLYLLDFLLENLLVFVRVI